MLNSNVNDATSLNARCVLALTATATNTVRSDVCSILGIENGGWKSSTVMRNNLRLVPLKFSEAQRISELHKLLGKGGVLENPGKCSAVQSVLLPFANVSLQHQLLYMFKLECKQIQFLSSSKAKVTSVLLIMRG